MRQVPGPPPMQRVMPPPGRRKNGTPPWVWVIAASVIIFYFVPSRNDGKDGDRIQESNAVDSSTSSNKQVGSAQISVPQPEWVSAVGKIEAGVTVYFRNDPESKPEAWFTVVQPYVDGPNGPQMLVKFAATGDTEYMDRRATMRSEAALRGQLVIHRSQARF